MLTLIYTIVVGLMLLAGLVSVIYTINKVSPYRKPLYWIALIMNIGLIVAFGFSVFRQLGYGWVPTQTILYSLEVSLFLVSLELILVPYVDRLEARTIKKVPSNQES